MSLHPPQQKNAAVTPAGAAAANLLTAVRDLPVTALTFTPAYLTGKDDATAVAATWAALESWSVGLAHDGVAAAQVTGTDEFAEVADMAGVAVVLQTAFRAATSTLMTVAWSTDHFIFTSANTTSASAIPVMTAGTTGTDISGAGATPFLSANTGNGTPTARSNGTYTLAATDRLVRVSATTTDAVRLIVPTVESAGDGREYEVDDVGTGGAHVVTLVHNGTQKINGAEADLPLAANARASIKANLAATDWAVSGRASVGGAAAANAAAAAGATGVTGTGNVVLTDGATLTGATVNELTTAIIARISLLEYICANDFDPLVTGIAGALVGARCSTVDGAKCWQKYGAATTAWRSLNETRYTVTLSAGPVNVWDVPLVIASNQACTLTAQLPAVGEERYVYLRLNGQYQTGGKLAGLINATPSEFGGQVSWTRTSTTEASQSTVVIFPAINGKRRVRFDSSTGVSGYAVQGRGLISADAITSVGMGVVNNNIGVGACLCYRIPADPQVML